MRQLICFFIITWTYLLPAQCISFSYDAAGDRIQRNICGQALQIPQKKLMENENYVKHHRFQDNQVVLSPNPTDGVLEIKTTLFNSESEVLITDVLGRKHYLSKLGDGRIDLTFLYPGQYFFAHK